MTESIIELLNRRTEFLGLLDNDIEKNENVCNGISNEINSLEQTRQNVQELGAKAEHTALIPLCKGLFIPGTIVHTGEYLTENRAHPSNYLILKTLNQTLRGLDERINVQRQLFEKAKLSAFQLEERKKLLLGEKDDALVQEQLLDGEDIKTVSMEVALMPKEIKSDKGVAVKVGNFYEILEYEEN